MKVVAISDTHGKHALLKLPKGDMIIHAGDISDQGAEREVREFLEWFSGLNYQYKIFIAGNHDFYFEKEPADKISKLIPEGVTYLNDSGVTVNGIKVWGSPVTPWYFNWAFNRHRGKAIKKHWDLIPPDTNILVTHGPAYGALDQNRKGEHLGCKDLCEKITHSKIPFHVCGHIHEGYGITHRLGTKFINCSVLDERYRLAHAPVQFVI